MTSRIRVLALAAALLGLAGGGIALSVEANTLTAAALLGLGFAGAFTLVAAHLLVQQLAGLLEHARRLGARVSDLDELGGLTTAMDQLAGEVDRALGDLADERDRFRLVLETMNEGLVALSEDGDVVVINRAARRLLGVGRTGSPGQLVEATRAPALATLAKNALAGQRGEVEVELRSEALLDGPGARSRRLLVTAQPQPRGGCVLVLREITELRRLEAVRRDFVANVSHELRTPVAAIRASGEALEAGALADPELSVRFLGAILRNAERLGTLIGDLLSLSRIEAGSYKLERVDIAIQEVLDRSVASLRERIAERGHRLSFEFDVERVVADPGALEQVLTNLVGNAVTYTPRRGRIEVSSVRVGELVRIQVADDGPGVPAEHRPRLFERFYRVDPGRSRSEGGTGLGLAIVKHLVESMGGRVGMTPNQPRGSIFWVELPGA